MIYSLPNLDINKKDTSVEKVTKKEEKKKENDLPPLPNLDINKKDTSVEKKFFR